MDKKDDDKFGHSPYRRYLSLNKKFLPHGHFLSSSEYESSTRTSQRSQGLNLEKMRIANVNKRYLPLSHKGTGLGVEELTPTIEQPRRAQTTPRLHDKEDKPLRFSPSTVFSGFSVVKEGKGANRGIFPHYRAKKKKFYYEEVKKGVDEWFHADVGTQLDSCFKGRNIPFKERKSQVFYHVVDLDTYEYHKMVFHTYLNTVLQSGWFRFLIMALVIISALMIGLTTYPRFDPYLLYFKVVDQIILSVFIFEIAIKWFYDFRLFWKVWWNIADFLIVLIIVVTAILPLGGTGKAFVIIRVVRAFRTLKSVSSLKSLTIVTHTVLKSGADMLSILVVLIIIMLVMSIMGVILFDIHEVNELGYFSNAPNAWYLLFICVSEDGWVDALVDFRNPRNNIGSEVSVILTVYLFLGVAVGSWIFANLIIAVIVANLEVSVKELRDEMMLVDDPLNTNEGFLVDQMEIIPTYELFSENSLPLLVQRPMKIPTFRYLSARRLKTYIMILVALEQNMLETETIRKELRSIMSVILAIALQTNSYSGATLMKEKVAGQDLLEQMSKLQNQEHPRLEGTLDRMEKHEQMQRFDKMERAKRHSINMSGSVE